MSWQDAPEVGGGWRTAPVVGQETLDPTEGMSTFQKIMAGIGKGMTDTARGAGQMVGLVSRDDVAEARRLDAPLMNTKAGMAGNFAGNVAMLAPTAMIPGVNTMAGATALGGAFGALQPSVSTGETALNVGLGALGGAGGQYIANKVPGWGQSLASNRQTATAAEAQRLAAAKAAQEAGFVIPPADVRPGNTAVELASGLSGKIKTAQQASARNQPTTNNLIRQDLGIAPDQPLTRETLQAIRRTAGDAYQPFKTVGQITPDATYTNALDNIASKYQGAARSFPDAAKNDVVKVVESLKVNAFDAGDAIDMTKVLREQSDTAFGQGNKGLANAYKQASDAIEAQIERHLQANGNPDVVAAFRKARQTIAKTYTVEKALNSGTGDVSAISLAAQLRKGKPLSGDMRTVAEFGEAFPKAAQALKESPKTFSPLDFGAAGIAAMSSGGNPLSAAGLLARPFMRSALLSNPAQKGMLMRGPELNLLERSLPLLQYPGVNRPLGASLGLLGGDFYE